MVARCLSDKPVSAVCLESASHPTCGSEPAAGPAAPFGRPQGPHALGLLSRRISLNRGPRACSFELVTAVAVCRWPCTMAVGSHTCDGLAANLAVGERVRPLVVDGQTVNAALCGAERRLVSDLTPREPGARELRLRHARPRPPRRWRGPEGQVSRTPWVHERPPQRTRHLRTPLDKQGGLREEQEPDPVPASLAGDEAPAWPASLVSAASGRDHGPRRRQGPGQKRAGSGESARPAALTSLGRSRRGSADTRPERRSRPGRPRRAARPGFALPEVPRAAGMFCYRIRQSSCRRPGRSRLCPAGRVPGGGWGHRCG